MKIQKMKLSNDMGNTTATMEEDKYEQAYLKKNIQVFSEGKDEHPLSDFNKKLDQALKHNPKKDRK